ncbi:hypothetical protein A4D02_14525 [Niastella koreensis]|nr:hypothetical protein A4D02_14525 [Niastella koreensis]
MWLIIILGTLVLLVCWLLVAPVELEIDTIHAQAAVHWISIGSVRVWYEEEWWFSIQVFFFHKTMPFSQMKKGPKKATATLENGKQKKKLKTKSILKKVTQVIGSLQITEWRLAIDSGEYNLNARLYPLNFLSWTAGHLFINFQGNNYLVAKLRAQPWKIALAFIK